MEATVVTESKAHTNIGRCIRCGYDLRGLVESRCPECGRTFVPSDPWTMNMGRPMPVALRRMAAHSGRSTARWICFACGLIAWGYAWLPGGVLVARIGLAFLGLIYLVRVFRFVFRLIAVSMYRQPATLLRPQGFRDYLPAIIVGSTGVAVATFLPLRLSIAVNHLIVRRQVERMYTIDPMLPTQRGPQRLGLFDCERVYIAPTGITFEIRRGERLIYAPCSSHFFPAGVGRSIALDLGGLS